MTGDVLPRLLRAMAGGSQAKENRHDVILYAAADRIEDLELSLKACLVFVDRAQWWATGTRAQRFQEKRDAEATAARARALLREVLK